MLTGIYINFPFSGALYDSIGDYDAGFYFAGSMIFLSGAMLFAIPALQKHLASKSPSFKITSGKGQDDILAEAWVIEFDILKMLKAEKYDCEICESEELKW